MSLTTATFTITRGGTTTTLTRVFSSSTNFNNNGNNNNNNFGGGGNSGSDNPNKNSLIFGCSFVAILVVCLTLASVTQRYISRRRRMMYGVLEEVREKRLEEVRPRIWDVYVDGKWRWRWVPVLAESGFGVDVRCVACVWCDC